MNPPQLPQWNLTASLVCLSLLAFADLAGAQTITVLGPNAPTPGPDDQYQTNFVALAQSPAPAAVRR